MSISVKDGCYYTVEYDNWDRFIVEKQMQAQCVFMSRVNILLGKDLKHCSETSVGATGNWALYGRLQSYM